MDLYPNTVKDSNGVRAAEYHVAGKYIPVESIGQAIERAGQGRMISVTPFAGYRVTKLDQMLSITKQLCGEPGRKYIYAYWNQPDEMMHTCGCHDARTKEVVLRIDKSVEALCKELRDTLVLVIADHGHIDTKFRLLSDYPQILSDLVRPFAIESRAAAFYVKDACRERFPEDFNAVFGDDFLLLSRDEVLAKGLFGNGIQHPRFLEFIGDYLAIATGDTALAYSRKARQFVSNHAGLTKQEMDVPLILIEKPAR